ncbi:MAG: MFS transporter [Deltaproteobacteria bacterium]|nr:MFS transporter [Deltaproteobacteria bacterium]
MSTQFFGALNDNLLKTIVSLVIVASSSESASALSLAGALFVVPFLLFSSYSGFLADRFSKTSVIRIVKCFELAIVCLAAVLLAQKHLSGLMVVLFLMGVHSALFSPAKYGILPEVLDSEQLSKGNGYMQFWTFVAILVGTALGGVLMAQAKQSMLLPSAALILVSLGGLASGFFVTRVKPANPQASFAWNPFGEVYSAVKAIRKDRALYLTLIALSYFWFLGAVFQLNIYLYASEMLKLDELHTAMLVTALALGIGVGSILAGKVSEGKVEMGLVPLGAIGISLFSMLLSVSYFSYTLSLVLLFALGMSGGFFVVPLSAFMQQQSPPDSRGRYLAANNFINFVGVLAASLVLWIFKSQFGLTSAQCFLVVGCSTIGVIAAIFETLPEAFVRCLNWLLMHSIYRVRAYNIENVPSTGGALLVCNHASFVDPCLLLGSVERPIRFLMFRPIYEALPVRWVARTMKAIPVSPFDKAEDIAASLKQAQDLLKAGELVCIFAEGSITRTGNLLPFRKGFERIMQGLDAPIIPVHIDRVWGSIFSFKNGKFLWKIPKQIPYPISVSFGKPMPAASKTYEVREAVQELASEVFEHRESQKEVLQSQFIREARRHPLRACMSDSSGRHLNYLSALIGSLALAAKFERTSHQQKNIGILLPPGVPAALANLATQISGRVPVNLNYTASSDSLRSACEQCDIRTVISARALTDKLKIDPLPGTVFIEDIFKSISSVEKLKAACCALFMPLKLIARSYGWKTGDAASLATVIFSSGSTGAPKGVMLSHANISSNVHSLYDLFQIDRRDSVLGVLPFFHSFGFTGTLWFPLLSGIHSTYHHNPMDASKIGELAAAQRSTIFMATPTFLMAYIRKCAPEQFASFRYVVVGAEKLKSAIAEAFEEKFNLVPLEGYGCTELSPVAILNIPDFEAARMKQIGNKKGKVGHPIPGVVAKIVDVESGQSLPPGKEGLLLVKGPNVMLGYLGQPEKTAEVIQNGWYVTGDIAAIDHDGFVAITDRLSRFSKIGGEMIPHVKLEEEIQRALGATAPVCVVTSLPDEKKGERLVVLCTVPVDAAVIAERLSAAGLPNLWIPKKDAYFGISELPMLGTGKLDLKQARELAKKLSATQEEAPATS